MNMCQAIAGSVGNKARAYSIETGFITVQERYSGVGATWLHVWILKPQEDRTVKVSETDIPLPHPTQLLELYHVDPDGDDWEPVS